MSEEKITCGNHGCILDSPSVGTNGGCMCINKQMSTEEIIRLKKYIYRERDKVKQLEEKLKVAVEGFENIKKIDKKEMFPQVKSAIMLETAKECLKKIGEQNEG